MNNKKIQEERMKAYFLESAKNILKSEGIKGVSVRNVAYHAGYSYATLYNYFKDINDLLFKCVEDLCAEAEHFVAQRVRGIDPGKAGLRAAVKAYAEYFVEYPGVFELFFLEQMGDFPNRKETASLIAGLLGRVCRPNVEYCVDNGIYSPEEGRKLIQSLHYLIPGMLLFYCNRLSPDNYGRFVEEMEDVLSGLL